MYEYYQLKNKANVYLIPQKDAPSVTILIMYPVGSRYEPNNLQGASHFIEHLMFKGTKKRPSTLVLTREIDRLGAMYNAFTGKECTGYYIKVDASYAETAIDILSDMVFNSKFEAQEMEREKTVIVEEIRMYRDNPLINIGNVFEDLIYAGCALGRDIAGSEDLVLSLKRKDVLEFRDRHYGPDNMTIAVSGKITDETKKFIEQYFGSKENKQKVQNKFQPFKFGSAKKMDRINVQTKPTDQTQLMIGFPGLPYNHKQNPVLSVLNTVLGGSMSSRLFIEIREKRGLAYMVRSGAEEFRDTGYFYVRAGLESKNINEAIKVVKGEVEKVIKKGVTSRELRDAKTNIRGSLMLAMEDSSTQASWYATEALFKDKIKTPEEKLKEIDSVTNEQIIGAAKQVFKMEKMRVAVIGNVEVESVRF